MFSKTHRHKIKKSKIKDLIGKKKIITYSNTKKKIHT